MRGWRFGFIVIAMLMAGSLLAACQSKGDHRATRLTTTRSSTTTTSTTESTTMTTVLSAPCKGALLFQAAIAQEHFDPNDPSYQSFGPEDRAGAHYPKCVENWAVATISRPDVGTTDGATLFHWEGKWVETWQIEDPVADCLLVQHGVPQDIAAQLIPTTEEERQQACD